jgi:2-polyprenyl-3-methyl-5-hydroxy-6-metoxy-1,4-benzoquinol methylase
MSHYNEKYFKWQQTIGMLSGSANRFMYQPYIGKNDVVLDFGCGGGYLLAQLECGRKIGVEINRVARATALSQGVEVAADIQDAAALPADVIISSHALEHTRHPFAVIQSLHASLRIGGRLVLVTPFERNSSWRPNDINQHLYTWAPMNLGNLVSDAGFRVDSSEIIYHRFPPKAHCLRKFFGQNTFHFICLLWGRLSRSVVQVRVVATKI